MMTLIAVWAMGRIVFSVYTGKLGAGVETGTAVAVAAGFFGLFTKVRIYFGFASVAA